MAGQSHIILRQLLELNLQPEREGDYQHLSEELSNLGQSFLPAMLDRIFSDLIPPDVYIRLDHLELTVEIEDWSNVKADLKRQLPGLLRKAVKKQLKDKLQTKKPSQTRSEQQVTDDYVGPIDGLIHFLIKGYLPWNTPMKMEVQALWTLFLGQVKTNGSRQILTEKLRKLLVRDMWALKRFLHQFGMEAAWELLILLEPGWTKQRAQLPIRYQELLKDREKADAQFFWTCLFENPQLSWQEQVECFLASPIPQEMSIEDLEAEKKVSTESIFIEDAGLVLLHPFMSPFLQGLNLAEDKKLTNPAKAAAVIHSLVWGKGPDAEWQLVMPKLLLGLPLDKPLSCQAVSEEELTTGENLLQQAINHWTALGNTSVKGFRESFLQREGRLQQTEIDWRLVVSQRPYDMLLERLPWNLSIIKLPWMPQLLRVQWV